MHRSPLSVSLLVAIGAIAVAPALGQDRGVPVSSGGHPMDTAHERHTHQHNPKHPAAHDATRFMTNRSSPIELPLPEEEDAFFFVVFGDRTGGPASGVAVLKDAVRDTNLLEPDLVMTVGDMINGYNQTDEWMSEMREYKGIMDELICPWFPVAGNHDTYWRGPNRPEGEHDRNYELHFGPLWYAFEHKNCMFIALYSDEGNPETGEKSISRPDTQVMSDEQLAWLRETLAAGADMEHIFVFLHHPRWRRGNYGEDWYDRVHPVLVDAGNVSAVFAGHIHRMKYQDTDGIEYFTLATVGGGNGFEVPRAGNLHHFNVVTVREGQIATASIPVGEVMDPRELTEDFTAAAGQLANVRPTGDSRVVVEADGSANSKIMVRVENPTDLDAEMMLGYHSEDSRWFVSPDHVHGVLEAGETRDVEFRVVRAPGPADDTFRPLSFTLAFDLLTPAFRYPIPEVVEQVPSDLTALRPSNDGIDRALRTGPGAAIARDAGFDLPDGPFTLECRFKADGFDRRTGLVAKTQNSDYGIFVSRGKPHFAVHLEGRYETVESDNDGFLEPGRWYHIAGVFDGSAVRLYVDGELVSEKAASGSRRMNELPLVIGGDVGGRGEPTSTFNGLIDDVRVSVGARYRGERFTVPTSFEADSQTVLLADMDSVVASTLFDASMSNAGIEITGDAEVVRSID